MYISYDDGDHWESLSLNLPDMPIADLEVEDHDLAIATHGRGFYILDNIEPLRQYKPAMAAEHDVVLFTPAAAIRSGTPATDAVLAQASGADTCASTFSTRRASSCAAYPDTGERRRRARWRGGGWRWTAAAAVAARGPAPRRQDRRSQLVHVGWPLRERRDVPGHDSLGRDDEWSARGAGQVHRASDRRRQDRTRTPLVLKRHPLHEATDADLIAQTQLALQIRDKVTEANSAVIQIRDLKKQIADRLTKSQDAQAEDRAATN